MRNEYNPEAHAAVLLVNGYNPDEYYIDPDDGRIYTLDGDVSVNDDTEYIVKRQLEIAMPIKREDLRIHNEIALLLRPGSGGT